MSFEKFEHRAPSHQTAVDIFGGRWASDLSQLAGVVNTGGADLFVADPRPAWAAAAFGKGTGRLDGMRVLELGPLEGAHSYQLEQLGARSVLGIDANAEAFLKCLVVKEVLGLTRCRFRLGDALEFLESTTDRFDLVFCSGLLYEVGDPMALIKACCNVSNRCFVWTHYHNPAHPDGDGGRVARKVKHDGAKATYYEATNIGQDVGTFWGSSAPTKAWMTKSALMDCFRRYGLSEIEVFEDAPTQANGAVVSFAASRPFAETFVRVTTPR